MLRGHQRHTRIHEFLLRVEHVERGSLSDPRLLPDTVERNFGGVHLRSGCLDLRLGGVQLAPALHHRSPRLIAIDINIEALLAKCFLVLANSGIFSAALIKRDGELSQNGDVGGPKFLRYRLVTLRIGSSEPKIRMASLIFTASSATSTPYIAASTDGLCVSPRVIARGSVAGDSRSTGVPGASRPGSTPMTRR